MEALKKLCTARQGTKNGQALANRHGNDDF
jgi:hypothetical protein